MQGQLTQTSISFDKSEYCKHQTDLLQGKRAGFKSDSRSYGWTKPEAVLVQDKKIAMSWVHAMSPLISAPKPQVALINNGKSAGFNFDGTRSYCKVVRGPSCAS